MTPTGADRWNLFSAEELAWLSLGINVAEGEGVLPPATREGEVYAAFAGGLEKAAEERETLARRRAQGREDDGSHGAY